MHGHVSQCSLSISSLGPILSAEPGWEVVSRVKDSAQKRSVMEELLFPYWAVVERVEVDEKQKCHEEQESVE